MTGSSVYKLESQLTTTCITLTSCVVCRVGRQVTVTYVIQQKMMSAGWEDSRLYITHIFLASDDVYSLVQLLTVKSITLASCVVYRLG